MEEYLLNTPSGNGIGLFAPLLGTSSDAFRNCCGIGRRKLRAISTFFGDRGSSCSWTDSETLSRVLNLSRRRRCSGWVFLPWKFFDSFSSKTSSSPAIDFKRCVLLFSILESGGGIMKC